MKFNRLIVSQSTTKKLSILKGRTGLTPNILCRYGLMLSLKDSTIPNPEIYKQDGQEFLRHILLGDLDTILIVLFKQRVSKDKIDLENDKLLLDYFRAHINRGVELLYNRIKKLNDLKELIYT